MWEAKSGRVVKRLKGHTGAVLGVAFSADSTRLVSGSRDGSLAVWAVPSGVPLGTCPVAHSKGVTCVDFEPGGTVASGGKDGCVKIWRVTPGGSISLLHSLLAHSAEINAVSFSPDGRSLASGSDDCSAKIWDAEKGALLLTTPRPQPACLGGIEGPASPSAPSGESHLMQEETPGKSREFRGGRAAGHWHYVASVAFSRDGKLLATGGWDKTLQVWDVETAELVHFFNMGAPVCSVATGWSWTGKPNPVPRRAADYHRVKSCPQDRQDLVQDRDRARI